MTYSLVDSPSVRVTTEPSSVATSISGSVITMSSPTLLSYTGYHVPSKVSRPASSSVAGSSRYTHENSRQSATTTAAAAMMDALPAFMGSPCTSGTCP